MNYRHHFHAGNFADVFKHALLTELVRGMQRKEKGFFYLDTHAGRGRYDLAAAARGDSLERRPEWPEGIGRVWAQAECLAAPLTTYLERVRDFNATAGEAGAAGPRFYPGSPRIVQACARPQDRLALCEKHPDEYFALTAEFRDEPRVKVHEMDGYVALRALLPPPERRALVLIDPPFEEQHEFARIVDALADGLRRLPSGVFAIWYPLTGRARVDAFFAELTRLALPPTLVLELAIAGDSSPIRLKGCGLAVLNPPWQFEATAGPIVEALGALLGQGGDGSGSARWLVPE